MTLRSAARVGRWQGQVTRWVRCFARARAVKRKKLQTLRRALSTSGQRARRLTIVENATEVLIAKGRDAEGRAIIIKYALSSPADAALRRHAAALRVFAAYAPGVEHLLPSLLHTGTVDHRVLTIETRLKGEPLLSCTDGERARQTCLDALARFHELGARELTSDDNDLERWLDEPLSWLRRRDELTGFAASFSHLRDELAARLRRPLIATRIHGDFAPCNILIASNHTVSGFVDFECSRADALPEIDFMHFALCSVPPASRNLGELVTTVLSSGDFHPSMHDVGQAAFAASPNRLDLRTIVLLAWLIAVADDLRKWAVLPLDWYQANVADVLTVADETRC